jgi:bifunctional oligoribonuclease and PAP phosphatase NrnA
MSIVDEIASFLLERNRFLITSHARPDGDSVASQLALAAALIQLGKSVEILNADPPPPNYRMLPEIDRLRVGRRAEGAFDASIVLECNNLERTEVENLEGYPAVNIDHHPVNDRFGVLNWVDPSASAVGEMLFHLFRALPLRMTPEIAANLYTAILTDTGSFQFSNTRAETFRVAAELVEAGADPGRVARDVMMNQSESRLRLLARLLGTLEFDTSRRVAWITLDRRMLDETGAAENDTEGLVNYPLSVDRVEVCAFFREIDAESYRVSLRSKGDLDVGGLAQQFGGGGHRNAAGLTAEGRYPEVRDTIVRELRNLIETSNRDHGEPTN